MKEIPDFLEFDNKLPESGNQLPLPTSAKPYYSFPSERKIEAYKKKRGRFVPLFLFWEMPELVLRRM